MRGVRCCTPLNCILIQKLAVSAQECLYVGDGGSNELAAAESVGMHPAQAVWYLKEGTMQPVGRMEAFAAIEKPLDVIEIVQKYDVDVKLCAFSAKEMQEAQKVFDRVI